MMATFPDPAELVGKIASGHRTALEVVRSDVGEDLRTDRLRGRLVDPGVEQQHRDPGVVGLADRRHQLLGTRRREQNGVHPLLDQILDDLVLALDIGLAIGGERHQVDALGVGFAARPPPPSAAQNGEFSALGTKATVRVRSSAGVGRGGL